MEMSEYLQRLEELLRAGRMAPRDIEDAVSRCGQHILDAGPEHEAETLADLGSPEQLAQEILEDYRQRSRRSGSGLSLALKILLGIFLSPFIIAGYSMVLGLVLGGGACVLGGGLSALVGFGALLPSGFGTFLNFLGSGFMVAGIGLMMVLGGLLLLKFVNLCMRRLFGGRRAQA